MLTDDYVWASTFSHHGITGEPSSVQNKFERPVNVMHKPEQDRAAKMAVILREVSAMSRAASSATALPSTKSCSRANFK